MPDAFRILIVESNSQGAQKLADLLSEKDTFITTAVSARYVFTELFRQNFDLVILSAQLPNVDGITLALQIRNREQTRNTPILLLDSKERNESWVSKAHLLRNVDRLIKPVSPEFLRAKVNMWIENSRKSQKEPDTSSIIVAPVGQSNLESQESRNQAAIEGMQDTAILWTNADGIVVGSNTQVRRILGYEEQEILGVPSSDFFSLEDKQAGVPEKELREARENGKGLDECWHVRKDGSRFWAVGLVTPLWKSAGELEGYIKVLRDRSDQKIKDDLARDTEERYKQLLDSTVEGIFGFDLNGMCTFGNTSCLKLLGFTDEQELLGLDLHEIIFHRLRDGHPCQGTDCPIIAKVLAGEESHGEAEVRGSGGKLLLVEYRIHPVRTDGTLIGAVVTFMDISERRRSEERFKAMERHVRQAKKLESIGRLAGGIAHELNNDLTAVIGYSEILLHRLENPNLVRLSVEEILQSGKRAADLVQKLLDFAGEQPIAAKPIPLESFLEERMNLFREAAGEKIQLSLELDPNLPQVYTEPEKLEKATLGIISNAREAIAGEGALCIFASRVDLSDPAEAEKVLVRPGVYACLSIRDTGRGIPEETQERLFDPFFSTKEMGRLAVGLGLSSAYGFIKQSGGTIDVESEPNHGTVIKVFLPTEPPSSHR